MSEGYERRRNQQVGVFMLIAVLVGVGVFYIVASKQQLLGSTYTLYTRFSDVSGLRAGAPLRVAGMDAGTVTAVRFSKDLDDKEVQVDLEVDRRFVERIRRDSVASIATQGVLGDKYISISVGSPKDDRLEPGETVPHIEPTNMLDSIEIAADVLENLRSITREIDIMIKGSDGDSAQQSIQDMLSSLRNIITETEQGRGLIHELIYDPKLARRLDETFDNLAATTGDLRAVTAEIKDGDGAAHKLIYGDELTDTVKSVDRVAIELEALLAAVRDERGLLYALIYDEQRVALVDNLEAATDGLKRIVQNVENGEGTVGGLIADPTVYQDIKTLLGRAERNRILKAYVRQTMRANEREAGLSEGGGETRK